jgi:hypothetical protein
MEAYEGKVKDLFSTVGQIADEIGTELAGGRNNHNLGRNVQRKPDFFILV